MLRRQDQVAVIKKNLQLLLPGVQIFLDVDDLVDIGNLEQYITKSQCVLVFLSRGSVSYTHLTLPTILLV